MENVSSDRLVTRIMASVAAGTTDQTSSALPLTGYVDHQIHFLPGTITATAVTTFKLQECATSGGSYTDISGKSVSVADTDDDTVQTLTVQAHELKADSKYLKAVIDRGTANCEIDGIIAVQRRMTA